MDTADGKKRQATLEAVALTAGWPTPMAGSPGTEDYNPAGNTDSSRKTVELMAGWAAPAARDCRHPNARTFAERGGGKKGEQLPNQVTHMLAGWAAPKAADGPPPRDPSKRLKRDRQTRTPGLTGNYKLDLSDQVGLVSGPSPSPSPAPTESGGASPPARMVLNPRFSLWLQGYPDVWLCLEASGIPSFHRLLHRSSKRS